MGPENEIQIDPDKVQILTPDGEWVDLKGVQGVQFSPAPSYPPGSLFGVAVEQVDEGVYEIPDSLLVEFTGSLEALGAIVQMWLDANPGYELTTEYDAPRRVTRLHLKRVP